MKSTQGEDIYRAGTSLGKLLRTIYLCDYFTLRDFRQTIYQAPFCAKRLARRSSCGSVSADSMASSPQRRGVAISCSMISRTSRV